MIIDRVLELLDEKSITMADLCRYIGINTSTMTNWKQRKTDPPARFIAPICEYLGVSCRYLLTGDDSPELGDLTSDDLEWLSLFHLLPETVQAEFRGEIKGYLKRMDEESNVTSKISQAK